MLQSVQPNLNKEEPIVTLAKEADQLFVKLSKKCDIKTIFGDIIPVTELYYALLGQVWADEALCALWDEIGKTLALPILNTPQERRAWLERPEMAQPLSQITQLNLSKQNLKIFPPEIKFCTGLRDLNLNNNQIAEIPGDLNFPQLQQLHLFKNQLTVLPALNFPQLEILDLTGNHLTALPILNFPQLKHLAIQHNRLTTLPALNFPQLEILNLAKNQLVVLPALNFPQLKTLDLARNQLRALPALNFPQLKRLHLQDNQLRILPALILPQLTHLLLQDNQLTHMPVFVCPQLSMLCLNRNMLLFISDKDENNASKVYCRLLHYQFKNYNCKSKLARFFQSIGLDRFDENSTKSAFYDLEKKDQWLVFEMVYQVSGISSPDLYWGEHHTFDDMHVFYKAMRKAISTKFDRLSPNDKSKVYGICDFACPTQIIDRKWGEHHAFDHVLRLIDAMSFIE